MPAQCKNGISSHNCKKIDWVHHLYKLPGCADAFAGLLNNVINFSENFMMFPTSSKRMIVLINPFFKWRNFFREKGCEAPALKDLTEIPNEALFEPNGNKYISPQTPGTECNFQKNDKYIYSVKKLSAAETHYCNALFMDRIDTYLGFSSLERIVGSVNEYKKRNSPPFVPRADYTISFVKDIRTG